MNELGAWISNIKPTEPLSTYKRPDQLYPNQIYQGLR